MDQQLSNRLMDKLTQFHGDVTPDLNFSNNYELIIAVVLSAQTTDIQVNKVTKGLFSKYSNFHELANANFEDVMERIKTIGFFRVKAKNIINLSKMVLEMFNGKLPNTRDELMRLPGVGRKTANVVLSIAFDIPAFAVDTHVKRLGNRLGYSESDNPLQVEKDITKYIPAKKWSYTHLLLIRHGRDICKARTYDCSKCPIDDICPSSKTVLEKYDIP